MGLRLPLAVVAGGLAGALGATGLALGSACVRLAVGYPGGHSAGPAPGVTFALDPLTSLIGCAVGGYVAARLSHKHCGMLAPGLSGAAAWVLLWSGLAWVLRNPLPRSAGMLATLAGITLVSSVSGALVGGSLAARVPRRCCKAKR